MEEASCDFCLGGFGEVLRAVGTVVPLRPCAYLCREYQKFLRGWRKEEEWWVGDCRSFGVVGGGLSRLDSAGPLTDGVCTWSPPCRIEVIEAMQAGATQGNFAKFR